MGRTRRRVGQPRGIEAFPRTSSPPEGTGRTLTATARMSSCAHATPELPTATGTVRFVSSHPTGRILGRALQYLGVAALVVGCTSQPGSEIPSDPASRAEPGAAGVGHEYYPNAGNGGYSATNYAVTLRYEPAEPGIEAEATITATADKPLSRFNLDLRGLQVESVTVNGEPAEFSRSGDFELRITPAEPLDSDERFRTHVVYSGSPGHSTGELGNNGWIRDESGAMYVLGEPHSASYWYPVNDTPRNKAPFELNVTVPAGWSAVSIGTLEDKSTADGWTTWHWSADTPVAPYLTTLAVDRFTIERGSLEDGTPVLNAYAPGA